MEWIGGNKTLWLAALTEIFKALQGSKSNIWSLFKHWAGWWSLAEERKCPSNEPSSVLPLRAIVTAPWDSSHSGKTWWIGGGSTWHRYVSTFATFDVGSEKKQMIAKQPRHRGRKNRKKPGPEIINYLLQRTDPDNFSVTAHAEKLQSNLFR